MEPIDPHATRRVVLGVAAFVALLVAGAVYLFTFPEPERPRALQVPEDRPSAYADEPTPEELAEADIPVGVGDDGAWPAGLDCSGHGELVVARDRYGDVGTHGGRTRRRPSASLDLGEVRLTRTREELCLAWIARRPPRVPFVIDLEIREAPLWQRAWTLRLTMGPRGRRSVTAARPGESLRSLRVHLDVSRRRGRVLIRSAELAEDLPLDGFQWQVTSRSPLLSGGREFIDCVPDASRVIYPAASGEDLPLDAPCLETARAQP